MRPPRASERGPTGPANDGRQHPPQPGCAPRRPRHRSSMRPQNAEDTRQILGVAQRATNPSETWQTHWQDAQDKRGQGPVPCLCHTSRTVDTIGRHQSLQDDAQHEAGRAQVRPRTGEPSAQRQARSTCAVPAPSNSTKSVCTSCTAIPDRDAPEGVRPAPPVAAAHRADARCGRGADADAQPAASPSWHHALASESSRQQQWLDRSMWPADGKEHAHRQCAVGLREECGPKAPLPWQGGRLYHWPTCLMRT
jgi:hypothetical protein